MTCVFAAPAVTPAGRCRRCPASDVDDIRDELSSSPEIQKHLEEFWPTLSAEQLLTDLFADRKRLNQVARRIPAAERVLLERPAPDAETPYGLRWTAADVALLDEAAELLGDERTALSGRDVARRAQPCQGGAGGRLGNLVLSGNGTCCGESLTRGELAIPDLCAELLRQLFSLAHAIHNPMYALRKQFWLMLRIENNHAKLCVTHSQ